MGSEARSSQGNEPFAGLHAARCGPAVRTLLTLGLKGELAASHVLVAADALGLSEVTVWGSLAAAERDKAAAEGAGKQALSRGQGS
jgi:hypothetical protein